MASPFSIFRKNQKMMLAALTILAMFGFVFLPIIMDAIGGSSGTNPVAFKSKYGSMTERELAWLRSEKLKFLQVLGGIAGKAGISPTYAQYYVERQFGDNSEKMVVDTWLLARRAESLGMVVDDAAINEFLKQFSSNSVTGQQFMDIFKNAHISADQFFSVARDQLLAVNLQQAFLPSVDFRSTTPAQRWDYFCRLKRKAAVETVALPVADYIDQVEDPNEKELKQFFDEYKEQLPLPYSPTPGFKRPAMAALEFVMADFDKFSSAEAIPDAEVLQRYEKNKDRYDERFKKTEDAKKQAEAEKSVEPQKSESSEEKPAEQPKPDAGKEKPAEPNPTSPPAAEQGPKDSLQDAHEQPAPQTPEAEKKDALPTAKEPEADKKAAPPAAKTPEAEKKDADKADAKKPAPGELTDEQKKFIRSEIAVEKIQTIFEQLRKQMADYRVKWQAFQSAASGKGKGKEGKIPVVPPSPPDLEKFAKDNGLVAGRTPLGPKWELDKTELGATLVEGQMPTVNFALESLTRYRAAEAVSMAGNPYLFWKTEETREEVPKFEDESVKKEVLRAWKLDRAWPLALKAAEELAAEADKTQKPLKELLADRPKMKVVLPAPFTWLTFGNVAASLSQSRQPRLSDVPEVDMAGEKFMQAVFALEPGKASAAMNAPQTIAYAIRLIEYTPSYRVLWDQFTVDNFVTYAEIAEIEQRRIAQEWMNEIRAEAGFRWMPEHLRQRQDDSPGEEEE